MFNSSHKNITNLTHLFLQPSNSTHRQYEALRAYFVEGLSNKEAARRFGYTEGSFRVLVHEFRQNPHRRFFLPPAKGPHSAPKKDMARQRIIELRKGNLSIYDISSILDKDGHKKKKRHPKGTEFERFTAEDGTEMLRIIYGRPSASLGQLTSTLLGKINDWHDALADVKSMILVYQKIIEILHANRNVDIADLQAGEIKRYKRYRGHS